MSKSTMAGAPVTGTTGHSTALRLVGSDPVLAVRLLQLVHRAALGVRGEVNTVDRAVQLLGFEAVRSAVLAISSGVPGRPSGILATSAAQVSSE